MERRWLRDVTRALEAHGIKVKGHQDGRKHVKIIVSNGEMEAYIVTSASPSDVRTLKNIVRDAKHMLSEKTGV